MRTALRAAATANARLASPLHMRDASHAAGESQNCQDAPITRCAGREPHMAPITA